jgi:hypothetical protein
MNKKPRADSILKTLPPERQAAIAEYALSHTLAETVAWLKEDGLQTSSSAVSLFLSSYRLGQRLQHNESTVETLLGKLQATRPDWTAEQLHQAGQAFFSALAIDAQDASVWTATQRLNLERDSARTRAEFEREKIEIRKQAETRAREKLEFEKQKHRREIIERVVNKWLEDQAAQKILNSGSTNAEKIEQLGALMFGEDWGARPAEA